MKDITVKKSSLESTFNTNGKLVMVFEGPLPSLYGLMSSFYTDEEDLGPTIPQETLVKFANFQSPRGALSYLYAELGPKTPEELVDLFQCAVQQSQANNLSVMCLEHDLPDDAVTDEQINFIANSIFTHKS
jgi:hypothetical protein